MKTSILFALGMMTAFASHAAESYITLRIFRPRVW